jgi:hypothetical protein
MVYATNLQFFAKPLEQFVCGISKPRYFDLRESVFTMVALGYLAF